MEIPLAPTQALISVNMHYVLAVYHLHTFRYMLVIYDRQMNFVEIVVIYCNRFILWCVCGVCCQRTIQQDMLRSGLISTVIYEIQHVHSLQYTQYE